MNKKYRYVIKTSRSPISTSQDGYFGRNNKLQHVDQLEKCLSEMMRHIYFSQSVRSQAHIILYRLDLIQNTNT